MAFSITRDLFEGAMARRRLSSVAVVLSVAPIVAPTLGGLLLGLGGWRAIHATLAAIGLLLFVVVAVALPETRPSGWRRTTVLQAYATVLRHPVVLRSAWINALNFGGMFAYIAGSPSLLMGTLRVSPWVYGLLFALTAAGILCGAWLNGRLAASQMSPAGPLAWGLVGQTATAACVIGLMIAGPVTLAILMPVLIANTFCRGLVAPNAVQAAMEPLPDVAGVAAAVVGALQMVAGAAASALVGWLSLALGPLAMGLVMFAFAGAALVVGSLPRAGYAPGRERQA
jgi:DHA1 family bicyclomycin/chloramphenicol resistance-like MFS transporter